MYVMHPNYAPDATHYLRAYSILQSDLLRLFEFIEPADTNEAAYSYRCLEVLLRACGEVEANCKAIFESNGFGIGKQLTMMDYRRLDATHRLSSYQVRLPVWTGTHAVRHPFANWASASPDWFKAHHGGKHNRHSEFSKASFGAAVDAVAGVVALLAAQFITYDYSPVILRALEFGDNHGGFEQAIGSYFEVRFPDDWPADQRYDFDWQVLRKEEAPFQMLSF